MSAVSGTPTIPADMMPQPAQSAPPAVAVDSVEGKAVRYAREDHTHESRLQARRVQLTPDANGRAVYIFPRAYADGVVPIVEVIAETPAGATYRLDAAIVQGSTTNTQTTVVIYRMAQTLSVSVLGTAVSVLTFATGPVWVNIMSRAPS